MHNIGWDSGAKETDTDQNIDTNLYRVRMLSHISILKIGSSGENNDKEVTHTDIVEKIVTEPSALSNLALDLESAKKKPQESKYVNVENEEGVNDKLDIGKETADDWLSNIMKLRVVLYQWFHQKEVL